MRNIQEISHAIVEELIAKEFLDPNDGRRLLEMSGSGSSGVDRRLLSNEIITEAMLGPIVADAMDLEFIDDLSQYVIDAGVHDRLPSIFWFGKPAVPISMKHAAVVVVGLPFDKEMMSEIEFHLQSQVTFALAEKQKIRRYLQSHGENSKQHRTSAQKKIPVAEPDIEEGSLTARAVSNMVEDAVAAGASDIHLNTDGEELKVRFRVLGELQDYRGISTSRASEVMARLKLLGGMNVTERRMPQDGSCAVSFAGRSIELRLSTLPTQGGESMVCRILDPRMLDRSWEQLGFSEDAQMRLLKLIEKPSGLFVISGPTGAGKSTTIYAALQHLNDGTRKIVSVEDPIEQNIVGIDQVQVNPSLGLGFGHVLRTSLRHDPDVIMIGEIRDEETAEVACRAALIGRLVLATVHASSASLVRERFINLGVPAYLIDEVLIGVMSQRLEVAECDACAGTGCHTCGSSGRWGRKPIIELWDG